ncbi:hypothetical protein C8F01DRAFT_1139450 [Mycena amicta]|nr:hypothetical protein C8F01DRAFT_1139450 [Mycena amicta]
MDRFLTRIGHTIIAALSSAIRAGFSVTKRRSGCLPDGLPLCTPMRHRDVHSRLRVPPYRPSSAPSSSISTICPSGTHTVLSGHGECREGRFLLSSSRSPPYSPISLSVSSGLAGSLKRPLSPLRLRRRLFSLAPEPTAAPAPPIIRVKRCIRADKRYRRGKKLHVEVEEKGNNAKRKRA